MNSEEFFGQFKHLRGNSASAVVDGGGRADVYLQLSHVDGRATVDVVDGNGRRTNADYRRFDGSLMFTLRTIATLQRQLSQSLGWGRKTTATTGLFLDEYSQLMITLTGCDNIVDEKMKPVTVSSVPATFILKVRPAGDDGREVTTTVELEADGERHTSYTILGENYVWLGHTIYPVKSLGPNHSQLGRFVTTIPVEMLDNLLSIFFSFIDNVQLDYEYHPLVVSPKSIMTVPTLIFEKIDDDKSLYMRVSASLPEQAPEVIERFRLAAVATTQDDGTILLRRVVPVAITDEIDLVKQLLNKAATARERREVYNDERGFFIVPAGVAGKFLTDSLPQLSERFRIIGVERLGEYRIRHVKPKLRLALSSGIDYLDGEASIDLGEQSMTIKDFLSEYNRNRYITLNDKSRAVIDEEYIKRLQRIFRRATGKDGKVKLSFFDLPEVETLIGEKLAGAAFKTHRSFYEGFNALPGKRIKVTGINATLRDYQRQGLKWINYLYDNNLGGCLADDMGLGKTLQTIAMLVRVYPAEKKPSLIVMPRSLLFNWQQEFAKFAPQITLATYYGPQRDLDESMRAQVVLTTYAIMRNDIEKLSKLQFHYVILDESQNIKNVSTGISQAVLLLNNEKRLALSGTPIENNLTELYSLFRFLNPGMFGSLEDFNRDYTYPIQRDDDEDAGESLRRRIYPFVLRRLKRDVLTELPERTDQTLYVDMSEAQQRLYNERRAYYLTAMRASIASQGVERSQMMMLQALSELRRIASVPESLTDGAVASPKIDSIAQTVIEATMSGHKVVVFFNFIAGIELLGERIAAEGIDYTTMTGSTRDRQTVVERFQQDPNCKVMIMTLKTGGVGLNLTAADIVIIAEPWWNKAAEEQAINRLHRIGQHNNVLSYSIITAGTIEEKIMQLQERKAKLFNDMIGADSASVKNFSEDDINFILG